MGRLATIATWLLATSMATAQAAPPAPADKKPHDLTGLIRQHFARKNPIQATPAMLPPSIPEASAPAAPSVQADLGAPISEEASQMEVYQPVPMEEGMPETPLLPPPTVLRPEGSGQPVEQQPEEFVITDPMMPFEPAPTIPHWWTRFEYLILQTPDGTLPVPLAASNTTGLTAAYFQGGDLDYGNYSGGRFELGRWFGAQHQWGFSMNALFADSRGVGFAANSSSLSALAIPLPIVRPTTDPVTNQGAFMEFGATGETTGLMTITSDSRLWGTEFNFIRPLWRQPNMRLSLLAGARYLELKENLDVQTNVTPFDVQEVVFLGSFLPVGSPGIANDHFDTRNQFGGGQIGARFDYQCDALVISLLGRAAIGQTHQKVNVLGFSAFNGVSVPGGFLTQTTNIGAQSASQFSVIPEFNLQLTYTCSRFRFFGGYNILFWNVVRPGAQIDPGINLNRVPLTVETSDIIITYDPTSGPARPFQRFEREDIWIQGVNLGMEIVF